MGELISMDGWQRSQERRELEAPIEVPLIDACEFIQPECSSWVFTLTTSAPAEWFDKHASFVLVCADGDMIGAPAIRVERIGENVRVQCDWPKRWEQLGNAAHIHTRGFYLVSPSDHWCKLPTAP